MDMDLVKSTGQEDELFPASVFESGRDDTETAFGIVEQEKSTTEESTAPGTAENHELDTEDTTENTAEVIDDQANNPSEK